MKGSQLQTLKLTSRHDSTSAENHLDRFRDSRKSRSRKTATFGGVGATKGLLILATLYTVYFAEAVLLPIVAALILALTLLPLVKFLQGLKIPRAIGAALLLGGLIGFSGVSLYFLAAPITQLIDDTPEIMTRLRRDLRGISDPVRKVNEAAEQVEEVANPDSSNSTSAEVSLEGPSLSERLFDGTQDAIVKGGMTVVLLYFLLVSGDRLLLRLLRTVPPYNSPRQSARIIKQVETLISHYLIATCIINAGLGLAVATAFYLLDFPNPLLWGIVAGFLNFIPFVGAVIGSLTFTFVAVQQFESWYWIAASIGIYVSLTSFEAYVVKPFVLGRRLLLNPIAILVALLYWGWAWGIPGALLAVPILVVMKVLFVQTGQFRSLSGLIGDLGPGG